MTALMRPNPVRAGLQAGGTSYGLMAFEFFTPGLMPALAAAGAEWVVLDMEHSGVGIDTIKAMVAASRGLPILPFVRVPGTAYHLIAPVLDAGAMGIMVPMVETAEQAARHRVLVPLPAGRACGASPSAWRTTITGPATWCRRWREANARTLVIALIETAEGIANADAILAGAGHRRGLARSFRPDRDDGHHRPVRASRVPGGGGALSAACARHGKAAGILAGSLEMARDFRTRGFRCIGYGTDISLLQGALAEGIARLRGG